MASLKRKYRENVEGNYFVDDSCINCDTCRQLEPNVFEDAGGFSYVKSQPETDQQEKMVKLSIIACPTGSIGSSEEFDMNGSRKGFPLLLEDNVYYCGYNSPKSYGACSYFITHPDGNWLVDSPRFSPHLVEVFKKFGGMKYIFLTHKDDVADASKYQREFDNCEKIIHYYDQSAQRDAEIVIKGTNDFVVGEDFRIIPTPGHTKGHQVLLYKNRFLFAGDHLYWRRDLKRLRATRNYCWYDWDEQIVSMEKLCKYSFQWVLPGHGQRIYLEKQDMKEEMMWLVKQMEKSDYW